MNMLTVEFPADHPCGAGHFPGNPIIPGALLLAEVLSAIEIHLALDNAAWQVKSAKFPQPVRPGDKVYIDYSVTVSGEIRFDCAVAGSKVLSGVASSSPVTAEGSSS